MQKFNVCHYLCIASQLATELTITNNHNPDIICITETWFDETVTNELCLQNLDIVRRDHNRQGGGILIYINKCYSHSLVFSGSDDLELIVWL